MFPLFAMFAQPSAHKALRYITLMRWHVSSAVLKYTNARVRARIDLRDHEITRCEVISYDDRKQITRMKYDGKDSVRSKLLFTLITTCCEALTLAFVLLKIFVPFASVVRETFERF